jgi:hypothetical protein
MMQLVSMQGSMGTTLQFIVYILYNLPGADDEVGVDAGIDGDALAVHCVHSVQLHTCGAYDEVGVDAGIDGDAVAEPGRDVGLWPSLGRVATEFRLAPHLHMGRVGRGLKLFSQI